MAESIFKKHQLDITVDVELNDAQRKATSVKIKNMANEWQDVLDSAIKEGIEQGAKSASLKDVLTQFNAQLKAFKLEPLTLTVGELEVMDKPIEHAAKMVIQKIGDSFKGSGLGNIISEEITDSLNVLGGTVDKIYQKMEQGAKKSALNIAKSMREIEEAASRYTKKGDMKSLDSVLRVGVTPGKAQKNAKGFYEKSVSTARSDASWDQKYAADVAFVRHYEALDEKLRKEVFGAQLVEVEAYYTKLAAVHQDKMTALNNILAQNDYIGAQKTKNPVKYQFKGIEPWAQEKTLQEVKNILSGGLTVKGGSGGKNDNSSDPNINTKKPPKTENLNTKKPPVVSTPEVKPKEASVPQPKVEQSLTTSDTSAFNQKLFDAIEKLSKDIETSFKLMMNGDMDEDQFDDQLAELRGEFLKQFKFDGAQRIDDYLAEKSDNMGEWNSQKIYDKLSKKLSPNDSSWPRVKSDVDIEDSGTARDNIQTILTDMNKFLSSNQDKKIKDYFDLIAAGAYEMSDDVKAAVESTIGSVDSLNSINIGANNHGGLIGDKNALIMRGSWIDSDDATELQNRLGGINAPNVNLGKTQELIKTEEYLVDLQNRVNGDPISTIGEAIEGVNPNVLNATTTSVQSLVQAMRELYNAGIEVDVENLGNILYDEKSDQFGIVDMGIKNGVREFESFEEMLRAFALTVRNQVEDITDVLNNPEMAQAWSRFADMVDGVVGVKTGTIPNKEIIENSNNTNAEVAAEKAETDAINQQNEALKENIDLKAKANAQDSSNHILSSLTQLEEITNKSLSEVINDYDNLDNSIKQNVDSILQSIGLMGSDGQFLFDRKQGGNAKAFVTDNFVILQKHITTNNEEISIFIEKLQQAKQEGIQLAEVLGQTFSLNAKENIGFRKGYEIQERGEGSEVHASPKLIELNQALAENQKILNLSDEHLQKFILDYIKLDQIGLQIDPSKPSNFLLDAEKGITFIDIGLKDVNAKAKSTADIFTEIATILSNMVGYMKFGENGDWSKSSGQIVNRIRDIFAQLNLSSSEEMNKIIEEKFIRNNDMKSVLLPENTNISAGSTEVKASIDIEELRGLLNSITYNVKVIQDVEPTEANKVSINADELRSVLDGITYNVKLAQGESDSESNKIAIDEGILENVLNRITYDVKIAHDDSDKESNKIAIDESALEGTLNRVFGNILSPKDDGKKPERKKEPWALEKTLNTTIKGILNQIQTNTAKPESIEVAPAQTDVGNVLATENTLAAIKTAVESINSKVVEGSKVTTKDTVKATKASQGRETMDGAKNNSLKEQESNLNNIAKLEKEIGKLKADADVATNEGVRKALEEEIQLRQQLIGLIKQSSAEDSDDSNEYIAYHGTKAGGFKNYDMSKTQAQDALFFTDDRDVAKTYSDGVEKDIDLDSSEIQKGIYTNKLTINNPYIVDAQGKNWDEIGDVQGDTNSAYNIGAKKFGDGSVAYQGKIWDIGGEQHNVFGDEENVHKIIAALYDPDTADVIIARLKKQQEIQSEKFKQGLIIDTNDTFRYNREKNQYPNNLSNLVAEMAFAKGHDGVIFKNMVDSGGGDGSRAPSTVYAVRDASQAQIVDPTTIQDGKNNTLEEEISLRDKILEKQRQGLELDAQEEAYYRQMAVNYTKQAKEQAKQADREAKAAKKEMQKQAMLGKAGNAVGRAQGVYIEAEGLDKSQLPADFDTQLDAYYNAFEKLRITQTNLSKADIISEDDKKDLRDQINNVNSLTSELSELMAQYQRLSGDNVQVLGANTLGPNAGLKEYEAELKRLAATSANGNIQIKSFDNNTKTLTWTVKNAKRETTTYTGTLRGLDNQFVAVAGSTKRAESFLEATMRKMKEISSYMSGMTVLSRLGQELKRGIQYVREIDLALTELKKVTDETEETYDKFLDTAAKTADKVGSTIQKVVSSTADWARLGHSMEDAAKFAESTQILMNVSEFTDVSQATDTLISAVQAFGYTAETSMEVVDLVNTIGNNYAISTADLAQSLTKSSASLVAAGGDLAEAAALTATANAIIQDADAVGTALKTTSLRLRGTSVEVLEEEGVDSDGAVTSKSKLQSKVKALSGVDILTETGDYKSTYEILSQIADVWENISNMDQAALLELLAGKRNASVLAAILQNPQDLKDAYDDANDAAGSALEENEKYLDSIQGKIDQFNNAMQAMWSNALDSDMVKGFVSLGTILIEIIDKIGLLNSALIALATYSMIKNKMGPIAFLGGISDLIRDVTGKIGGFIGSLTGMTVATSAYTAETLAASVANGTLSASEAASIATKSGLTLATTNLTAAEAAEMLIKAGMKQADALAIVDKLGLTSATSALTMETVKATMANAGYTPTQIAAATAALFGAGANKTLASSFGALWTAMWPVLVVMLAITAVVGIVKLFDSLTVSAEEASEQLEETKNKISDLESELESLQTELDEAREKIAELTALPYLSLTQQEDLDRLEREVELLERQIALKERQLDIEERKLVEDAETAIRTKWTESGAYDLTDDGEIQEDLWYTWGNSGKDVVDRAITEYEKNKNSLDAALDLAAGYDDMSDYEKYVKTAKIREGMGYKDPIVDQETFNENPDGYSMLDEDQISGWIDYYDERTAEIASSIEEFFNDPDYAGLTYGMSDDIDAFLDEFNNAKLRWEKALYGDNSTVSAIESLWGPNASEETKAIKNEIDKIMAEDGDWANDDEKWQSKNEAIKNYIDSLDETAEGYQQLDYVINTLGVDAQKIADYFTVLNGEFNSNTIEGVAQQYAKAEEVMSALKNMSNGTFTFDGVSYDWNEFFSEDDQGKFKARVDKFAEILKGMDNDTRETFINIVESAANSAGDLSSIDWNQAIAKLDLAGIDKTFELLNNEFETLNNEMFAGAADEINGLIDTVSELQAALEDVAGTMDLLNTAQTQMNNSGRISVKTALELMQTTEDWDQILEITNGTIRLRDGAEQHLIQTELTAIKTQLHYAWTTAQARYETALAAQGELDYADNSGVVMTAESIKAEAIGRVSAVVVALGAAMDEITSGNWGSAFSAFGSTYKSATATVVQDSQRLTTSISELKKNADNAKKTYDAFSSVDDPSKFMDNYDFNKTPGDKYDDNSGDADDAFQRAMDYWENRIAANQARYEQLQNEIDLLESKGQKADASYYEEQIKLEQQRLSLLQQQKAEAQSFLGTFAEGSDEWFRKKPA